MEHRDGPGRIVALGLAVTVGAAFGSVVTVCLRPAPGPRLESAGMLPESRSDPSLAATDLDGLRRSLDGLDVRLARIEASLTMPASPATSEAPGPARATSGLPGAPLAPSATVGPDVSALLTAVSALVERVAAFDGRLEDLAKARTSAWALLGATRPDEPLPDAVLRALQLRYEGIEAKWVTSWQASIDRLEAEPAASGQTEAHEAELARSRRGLRNCQLELEKLPTLRSWLDFQGWCEWSGAPTPDVVLGLRGKGE